MAASDYYIKDNADIEGQKLDAAKGLYKAGEYNGALKLYLDLLSSSSSFKLYYEAGRCYYRLNDMENAELYFTRSVGLEDYRNPSYTYLGNIYYRKNDLVNAIEYWITAYSYKPDDEAVCLNLATSYFSKNMKFYAVYFYEKYLKYAKDKTSQAYLDIKKSIEEFSEIGNDFYKRAMRAVAANDNATAIQALEYAVNNVPSNFDINTLLGKLYYEEKNYTMSLKYLEHAFCIDSKSIDLLRQLSSLMVFTGDLSGAFCCLKRMLPLVLNNQKEYLDIIKTTGEMQLRLGDSPENKHIEAAKRYYKDNNYYMALFEYENCVLLNDALSEKLSDEIQRIKLFLHPEERIIKTCFEKGAFYHEEGDFTKSNKYFTKIMTLSDESSQEYKLAKSRMVNV